MTDFLSYSSLPPGTPISRLAVSVLDSKYFSHLPGKTKEAMLSFPDKFLSALITFCSF
jgi:hypothetical protein